MNVKHFSNLTFLGYDYTGWCEAGHFRTNRGNPRDRSPSAADVEDAGSKNPAKDRLPTKKNKGGGAGDSDTFSPRGVSN